MDYNHIPFSESKTAESSTRQNETSGWFILCRRRQHAAFCEAIGAAEIDPVTVIHEFLHKAPPRSMEFDGRLLSKGRRIPVGETVVVNRAAQPASDPTPMLPTGALSETATA